MGISERLSEFGQEYADYEPSNVQSLIVATGEWLERILGEAGAVDAAMKQLYFALCPANPQEPARPWRELWQDLSEGLELPVGQALVSLNAFAFYGLPPVENVPIGQREKAIREFVGGLRALFDSIPPGWADVSDMERTILAAEARLLIDTDADVSAEQLAALARLNIRTMKNQLMPSSGSGLRTTSDGHIIARDARRWLEARPTFRSSLWRDHEVESPETSGHSDKGLENVLFVPVANDGTFFDPVSCRRAGAYTIGPKGAEERIEDYRVALERLSEMKRPAWRRPNEVGNWGIVRARDDLWLRKTAAELGLAPIAVGER
jgi:hypothetical protein